MWAGERFLLQGRDCQVALMALFKRAVLLILGPPQRTVMSLMGWSTPDMATRYSTRLTNSAPTSPARSTA
jgi:hypothetical protein